MDTRRFAIKTAAVAALAFVLDQATKVVARAILAFCSAPPFERCEQVELSRYLGFARVENAGSALGFFEGLPLWIVVAAAGMLLIPLYGRRVSDHGFAAPLALGLQAGGALGNLCDRLVYGGVTDFIVAADEIVVNIADVALLAGMFLAVALLLRSDTAQRPSGPAEVPSGPALVE